MAMGDRQLSGPSVQKKFYERRQNPEVSFRDFSYVLNELMQKIEQVKPESVHNLSLIHI